MSKFDVVRKAGTSGISYGIATADIVETLERWDSRFGVHLSHVDYDFMLVQFDTLPDPAARLAEEIYGICPDVIRQQLACAEEVMEALKALDPQAFARLASVDDEALGLKLLEHALRSTRAVALWWHCAPRSRQAEQSVA